MKNIIYSSLLALMLVGSASAEEEPESSKKYYLLDEILITGTRMERPAGELSASVSVINKDDIDALIARSCPELLAGLPGTFVQKTGQFGRADIDIRGLGGRGTKNLILIDGRPEKMGLFGCSVTHTLPLANVERIEVIRGPASVLYGSDALGGVVNIITGRPKVGFGGDLEVSRGSFGTSAYRFRTGGSNGDLSANLTLDRRESDGHLPNSAYKGNDVSGLLSYRLTDKARFDIDAKYFDGRREEPSPSPDDTWNLYRRGALSAGLTADWTDWNLFWKLYRDFGHHEFSDGWHSRDHVDGMTAQVSNRALPNNILILGSEVRRYWGRRLSDTPGTWKRTEGGVWITDEYSFPIGLSVHPGVRWSYDSISGSILTPQAGIIKTIGRSFRLRANYTHGFRNPQLNELYLFPPSNPELKPEVVVNKEVGLKGRLTEAVEIDIAVFRLSGENLIQTGPNPSPPPGFLFQNVGKFEFNGLELALAAHPVDRLGLRFSGTWLDPGRLTTGRPGLKLDTRLVYTLQKVSMSVGGSFIGKYYAADDSQEKIPDYTLLWSKLVFRATSSVDLVFEFENMLDKEYDIYVDLSGGAAGLYRMAGRSLNLGVNLHH